MPSEAQRRANQNQDAARKGKRVAVWMDKDGPEDKELQRIMRKHKLAARIDAIRWLLEHGSN